jgi:hypothetical protein
MLRTVCIAAPVPASIVISISSTKNEDAGMHTNSKNTANEDAGIHTNTRNTAVLREVIDNPTADAQNQIEVYKALRVGIPLYNDDRSQRLNPSICENEKIPRPLYFDPDAELVQQHRHKAHSYRVHRNHKETYFSRGIDRFHGEIDKTSKNVSNKKDCKLVSVDGANHDARQRKSGEQIDRKE